MNLCISLKGKAENRLQTGLNVQSGVLRAEDALPLIRNYKPFFLFALSSVRQEKKLFEVDDDRPFSVLTGGLHLGIRRAPGASSELQDWPRSRASLWGESSDISAQKVKSDFKRKSCIHPNSCNNVWFCC